MTTMNGPDSAINGAGKGLSIVLVGAGQIAAEIARVALAQGHAIAGVVDIDPLKVGTDAGEAMGIGPLGVAVTDSLADGAGGDVAIVATSSVLEVAAPQLRDCLGAGLDVVSTCEQLTYPWRTNRELADALDATARANGRTLLGTGINPGFVMDTLALAASAPCATVRHARVSRVLDAGRRRPSFRAKVGAGVDEDEFHQRAAAGLFGHAGLAESAWMLADGFGLEADRAEESLGPVKDADGRVLGTEQWVSLIAGDREVVRLEMTMAIGVPDPADTIELDADPPVKLRLAGGVPGDAGTAGVVVNAARAVGAARPGLLMMTDLPVVRTRPRSEHASGAVQ